ncbi:MAG: glycosyltransferase [Chloroflexi bacterium]|nr:glycosyltransferase [Chloroflexota bacterium]
MLLQVVTACYVALRVLLTIGLFRRQPRSSAQPSVSVIVAARDEAADLPRLLDALLGQNYPRYEVIIVDDRSTDATPEMLRSYQARDPRLKIVTITEVPEGRTPKIHGLTQGIAQAQGELLLLTDADCRMPPTWISGMAACFTPDVGAVLGYVELYAANSRLMEDLQALDYFSMMATLAGATNLEHPVGAAGANLAYRRAAYNEAGGFEAMPTGAVADDMVLLQHVLDRTDWRVVFCDDPGAFVSTPAEPTLRQALNQRVRWMAGGQEVLWHNPALLVTGTIIGTLNGLLLSFPLLLGTRSLRRALLQLVAGRTLADLLHLGVAATRFQRRDLLRHLPLWMLLQMPYTMFLPLYSAFSKWSWK